MSDRFPEITDDEWRRFHQLQVAADPHLPVGELILLRVRWHDEPRAAMCLAVDTDPDSDNVSVWPLAIMVTDDMAAGLETEPMIEQAPPLSDAERERVTRMLNNL